MELRARTRTLLRRAAPFAALGVLIVPATAGAASPVAKASAKKKRAKPPVVRSISPAQLSVGQTLTIRGKNFRAGRKKNTVLFKRDRGRAVFVKADIGTKRMLRLKMPKRLESAMVVINGQPTATKFRLRVLTTRLGRKFTKVSLSPLVGPELVAPGGGSGGAPGAGGGGGGGGGGIPVDPPKPPAAEGDCDGDGVLNGVDADDDNDLLNDDIELLYKLNPCLSDTDGDSVADGFEYRSALDLNDDEYQEPNVFLPYPGKRPYPNPLDPEDAAIDFDGDVLTLAEEFRLWKYTVAKGAAPSLDALTYSDGMKYSMSLRGSDGRRVPSLPANGYVRLSEFRSWAMGNGYWEVKLPDEPVSRALFDLNRNGDIDATGRDEYAWSEAMPYDFDNDGFLSDDERDEDADGLTNWAETHGMLQPGYWPINYKREKPFNINYAGTDVDDPDSDGDGVRDGADDQDHDDYPNYVEQNRNMVTGRYHDNPKLDKALGNNDPWYGRVQPFNPCLPNINSRTCPFPYIPATNAYAPFDGPPWDPDGDDPSYLVLDGPSAPPTP
jgi:hypothetical protein